MGYSASEYNNLGNLYLTVSNTSCYTTYIKLEEKPTKPRTTITYASFNYLSSANSMYNKILLSLIISLLVSVF
jgi:hypothetical protein